MEIENAIERPSVMLSNTCLEVKVECADLVFPELEGLSALEKCTRGRKDWELSEWIKEWIWSGVSNKIRFPIFEETTDWIKIKCNWE